MIKVASLIKFEEYLQSVSIPLMLNGLLYTLLRLKFATKEFFPPPLFVLIELQQNAIKISGGYTVHFV